MCPVFLHWWKLLLLGEIRECWGLWEQLILIWVVSVVAVCSYLQSKHAALTSFTARGSAGKERKDLEKEMQSAKEVEQVEAFLYSEASWHVLPVAALNIYAMLSLVYAIHHFGLRDQRVCRCSFVKRCVVFVAAVIQIFDQKTYI